MAQINAASQLLRGDGRAEFIRDVITTLQLRSLAAPSNADVSQAITDVIGVVPFNEKENGL